MELKTQFSLSLALAIALVSGAAIAKETDTSAKTLTPQQQRMVDCNKEATGKTGDERKTFMSTCLKGESAAPAAKTTQQEKMTSCNAEATKKTLTGDARKTFMSACLKGDSAASAPAAAPAAAPTATAKVAQQEKMKSCSTDAKAKGLKGDERKTFMSTCLSADASH